VHALVRRSLVAAVVPGVMLGATPASASGGGLDRSFGADGVVVTHLFHSGGVKALAMDGARVVAAGTVASKAGVTSVAVLRYLSSGRLDTTFGGTGEVVTHLGGPKSYNGVAGVAVDSTGRILILMNAGVRTNHPVLLRYLPDGTLDPGFGTGGKVRLPPGPYYGQSLVWLPDGRIVLAGIRNAISQTDAGDVFVERLMPDGTPDGSFGTGGSVTTDVGGLFNVSASVHVLPDDRILAAGSSYFACGPPPRGCKDKLTLIQYLPDGELDSGFGTGGTVLLTTGRQFFEGSALQSNGDLVVATSASFGAIGCGRTEASLYRFLPSGALDTAFGHGGRVQLETTDPRALTVQSDDRIVVGGFGCPHHVVMFSVSEFRKNGAIDGRFGQHGTTTARVGAVAYPFSYASALTIQPDGKVVAGGGTEVNHFQFTRWALVRLLAP
jgi:uncharacterized delta-60 repeat protein